MPRTGLSAEELQERALEVALARMRLVGFDKVRMSDVAKDIGVSHAALYAHFADKDALLDAVTGRWLAIVERTVGAVASSPGDPKARIVEWFVTLYRMKRKRALDDPKPHRAFDVGAALEKPFVIAHLNGLIGQLTDLFRQAGPDIGGKPALNAKLLFDATAAFHHPTLILQSAHTDQVRQLRRIVELVFSGMQLSARKAGTN